jgi:hypothetical protein
MTTLTTRPTRSRPPAGPLRRGLRRAAVILAAGLLIWGLDLGAYLLVAGLLRAPSTAIVLNCLAGVALSAVALHPASPRGYQRLLGTLARRSWGRAVLSWANGAEAGTGSSSCGGAKR